MKHQSAAEPGGASSDGGNGWWRTSIRYMWVSTGRLRPIRPACWTAEGASCPSALLHIPATPLQPSRNGCTKWPGMSPDKSPSRSRFRVVRWSRPWLSVAFASTPSTPSSSTAFAIATAWRAPKTTAATPSCWVTRCAPIGPCFRRVRLDDPLVIQLRELSRVHDDLGREANQLTNRLDEQLHRYYSQALALCPSADEPWLWALLELAPSPSVARH